MMVHQKQLLTVINNAKYRTGLQDTDARLIDVSSSVAEIGALAVRHNGRNSLFQIVYLCGHLSYCHY